jgi:aconitase B
LYREDTENSHSLLGRYNLKNRKGRKECPCRENRKGDPGNVVNARPVASAITVKRTERTLATFPVDTLFKAGRVRRGVPVAKAGTVVGPVSIDLLGTTSVWVFLQSERKHIPYYISCAMLLGSTTFPILAIGTLLLTLPIFRIVSTETDGTVLLVVGTDDALA